MQNQQSTTKRLCLLWTVVYLATCATSSRSLVSMPSTATHWWDAASWMAWVVQKVNQLRPSHPGVARSMTGLPLAKHNTDNKHTHKKDGAEIGN